MRDYTSGGVSQSAWYDENEQEILFDKDDIRRDTYLRSNYGISLHDYQAQLHRQKYACEICFREFVQYELKPCVDHNHTTGAVRGILCERCNWGLGNFYDDENRLLHAVQYLLKYKRG